MRESRALRRREERKQIESRRQICERSVSATCSPRARHVRSAPLPSSCLLPHPPYTDPLLTPY